MNESTLKAWFIIREDISYSSKKLLDIYVNSVCSDFNYNTEWVKLDCPFETRMMFNLGTIDKLESFLIENGLVFKWIYDNDATIGILIEPTTFDMTKRLKDCMRLNEYAKHRLEQFNELSTELIKN